MLDMEVLKQLLHASIGELAAIVALEYLGGMLLEECPKISGQKFQRDSLQSHPAYSAGLV